MYLIYDFIFETDWQKIFFWAKIISGFFSVLFLLGIAILTVKLNLLHQAVKLASEARYVSVIPKRGLAKKWAEIEKKFKSQSESDLKLAVIEADKILDNLLERMGYHGKTMGERLEQVQPAQFPRLQEVWDAHKIRNNIVHDTDYKLSYGEAERAIKTYEAVLQELEVI